MKKNYAFLMLVLITFSLTAQTPPYTWAKATGGINEENISRVTCDSKGNSLVVGKFSSSTLQLDSIVLTNTGTTGSSDLFVAKYNPAGKILWAKSYGGIGNEYGTGITTDANDNVFFCGVFTSETFKVGPLTFTQNNNTGIYADPFLVKLTPNGGVLWGKRGNGEFLDKSQDVIADKDGNVIFSGTFSSSSILFESLKLTNTLQKTDEIFTVKYDGTGKILWAKSFGGRGADYVTGIAKDTSNNIFIAGWYVGDSIKFAPQTLYSNGIANGYVTKVNASGTVLWAKNIDGTKEDFATGISTDKKGNLFVSGYFKSPVLNIDTLKLDNIHKLEESEAFFAKLNPDGNALFARTGGGIKADYTDDVVVDKNDNIYVGGHFSSDTLTFGNLQLIHTGSGSDIFIVKYNPAGIPLWIKSATGSSNDVISDLVCDLSDNLFIAGYFESSTLAFENKTLTNLGSTDGFLVKIDATVVTAINKTVNDNQVIIYPNPFSDQTTIRVEQELTNATVRLLNTLGEEIERIHFSGKELQLNNKNLVPGIYIIQLSQNNCIINKKVVVQ
jgi:hypothetical protein